MDFLSEVEKKLDLPPGEKAQVMRELKSHYHEVFSELTASGMSECDASAEAARRLGDPQDVASRLQTVHCRATWKIALLTVLPFLGLMLVPAAYLLTGMPAKEANPIRADALGAAIAAFAAIMIAGSIRELRAGRRPVWLATWLAVGVTMLVSLSRLFLYRAFGLMIGAEHAGAEYIVWNSTQLLVIGALALWASRGSTVRTSIVAGVVALAIALTAQTVWTPVPQQMWMVVLYVALVPSALLMTIALRLFASHPYGTVHQASLFLLAAYGFRIPAVGTPSLATLAMPVAVVLLTGVVAWIAVRACTHRHKLFILSVGVYMVAVGGSLVKGWVSHPEAIGLRGFPLLAALIGWGVFEGMFYHIWVVMLPMWLSGGPGPQFPRVGLIIER